MKRTSILFLTLMGIFLGILIFVTGLIVGNRLPRPVDDVASAVEPDIVKPSAQPVAETPQVESAVVAESEPQKPVVKEKTSPHKKPIAKKPKPLKPIAKKPPKEEVGDTLLPTDDKQPTSVAKKEASKPETGKSPAIKKTKGTEVPFTYSVGLGAFLERQDAEELVADLKTKNHQAYIVNAWDSRGRLWSTVRIGHFADLDKASKTAMELKQKERLTASIQGMGSLGFVDISKIPEPEVAKTIAAKAKSPATP